MHVAQIEFNVTENDPSDTLLDLASYFLGALRMNGQILGREWPFCVVGNRLTTRVMMPEDVSLQAAFNNVYVSDYESQLRAAGSEVVIVDLGEDPAGGNVCACADPSGYLLFTNYLSLESPISCMDCLSAVPLYRLPKTAHDEYYDIICWQSDYQSCDSLQMNCAVLESASTHQLADLHSALTLRGRNIARDLERGTGKPVYYYLYRAHEHRRGKKRTQATTRPCPGCGGKWHLASALNHLFQFRCDRCRLLSNVGFS